MTYQLARNGAQLGTYAEEKLGEALASGELRPADLAWCEGMADWRPLSEIIPSQAGVAAAPGLPPPMPFTGTSGMATACLIGCKGLAIAGMVLVAALGAAEMITGLAVPAFKGVQEKARQMQAVNNARQIIIAMKSYGAYPDAGPSGPKTANEYFRLLIKSGRVTDERIFTAPDHSEQADGNIGEPPDFKHALEPGENHWSVIVGVSKSSSGNTPLIFERANDNAWPPTWNTKVTDQPVRGGTLKRRKVIVGRCDGSVTTELLDSSQGERATTKTSADGVNLFDPAKPMKYLQPE